MMVMVVVMASNLLAGIQLASLLHVLLKIRIVLLCGLQISRRKILPQLRESLRHGIVAGGGG